MTSPFARITFASLLLCTLAACAPTSSSAPIPAPSVQAPVKAPLTVQLSQSNPNLALEGAGLTLKLLEVRDSRCPQGVQCFWAGEVGITLEIAKIGVQYVRQPLYTLFDVNARSEPKRVLAEGYEFRILEVTPAPVQGEVQDKVVTLELIPSDR